MNPTALGALFIDAIAGEPPNAAHPTVWMGRWIGSRRASRRSGLDRAALLDGALLVGVGVLTTALCATALDRAITRLPRVARGSARSAALKPALSLRALTGAAAKVGRALERDDLTRARALLSIHLVSRDTSNLSAHEVAGAAIESVAENLSDSVIAPLIAWRMGGLPAAYAYRFINTADAMLGYRTAELEWFGKTAARTDDVANFVPARVSALLIAICARAGGGSTRQSLACVRNDASRTDSPNAGWPMAAMAGALDIRLTKRDQYVLNERGFEPHADDIAACCRIVTAAAILAAALVDLS